MSANAGALLPLSRSEQPDDRGVSAVIGIVLLVGLTVLLVTVIAGFVLAVDTPSGPAPQSDFLFDHTELESGDTFVTVTHLGGESIPAGELEIVVQGVEGGTETWAWVVQDVDIDETEPNADETLVVGGDAAGGAVSIAGESVTVQIRWTQPDNDRTYVLAETEVTA